MTTFFTTNSGKSHMKISTIEISINYCHNICSTIAVSGFINVIPYTFQLFKMVLDTLVICACLGIAWLINTSRLCVVN